MWRDRCRPHQGPARSLASASRPLDTLPRRLWRLANEARGHRVLASPIARAGAIASRLRATSFSPAMPCPPWAALGPRTIRDQRSAADIYGQRHRRSTRLSAGSVTAWTSLTTTRSQVRALSRPPANPAGHSLCDDPGHVLRSRQPRVTLLCLLGRCSGRFLRWNRDCGGGRRGLRPPPSVPPAAAGNDQKVLVDPGHLGASQAAQEGGDGLAQLVW